MKNNTILIYLLLLLTLNLSCGDKKSSKKDISKLAFVSKNKTDTLKFNSGIRAIYQDSKDNYWFGSHNEGVCLYDGKLFQYFTTTEGLSNNQVRSITEDNNGTVYFETANGVSAYENAKFIKYPIKTDNPIVDWNTTTGNLWFNAGEEGGINRFDGIKLNYLVFPKPKVYNPYDSYGVTGISKDKKGVLWIATYNALFNYNGKKLTVFENEQLQLASNEKLHIRSVLADSQGRIWIGNNGIGVLLLENNKTINFSDVNGLIDKKSTKNGDKSPAGTMEHVFAIEEDAEGTIWFGDRDTGVWNYNGTTMTNFIVDSKLSNPMVWTIYKDNQNNLLFGMAFGGVYKFNGTSFVKVF